MLRYVLTVPLPVQLSANTHEKKQQEMTQVLAVLPPMWETRMKLLALLWLLYPFGE